MTRPPVSGMSFLAQAWDRETLVSQVFGLSYDAAREIAKAATITGNTGRLMSEDGLALDWTEVYCPDGTVRSGRFAETTLVQS